MAVRSPTGSSSSCRFSHASLAAGFSPMAFSMASDSRYSWAAAVIVHVAARIRASQNDARASDEAASRDRDWPRTAAEATAVPETRPDDSTRASRRIPCLLSLRERSAGVGDRRRRSERSCQRRSCSSSRLGSGRSEKSACFRCQPLGGRSSQVNRYRFATVREILASAPYCRRIVNTWPVE